MASRRSFLKVSSLTLLGSTVFGTKSFAAGDTAKLVDEKSAEAKAVNYKADKSKIKDKALMTERQGMKFADQKCANCQLFQGKAGDKEAVCLIFQGKKVAAEGWCSSWNKKA